VEKLQNSFPYCGKPAFSSLKPSNNAKNGVFRPFSTVWKKVFHAVEKSSIVLP
jgi:hypothetical protein